MKCKLRFMCLSLYCLISFLSTSSYPAGSTCDKGPGGTFHRPALRGPGSPPTLCELEEGQHGPGGRWGSLQSLPRWNSNCPKGGTNWWGGLHLRGQQYRRAEWGQYPAAGTRWGTVSAQWYCPQVCTGSPSNIFKTNYTYMILVKTDNDSDLKQYACWPM